MGSNNFNDNIKVSVIVAVYNAEKYLKQCLDSICNQTYRNIEIICVNDGSDDSSLDILNEYAAADDRIKIYTKENEGLGGASARNFGLDKACGKYISILDSDDYFELNMLEAAVKRAEKYDVDMVVFGGMEYDNKNGRAYKVASILDEKYIPDKDIFSFHDCPKTIFQLTQGMAWNKLYKKDFLDEYKLKFQKVKYTDDAYFTFAHMILAKKITVLKEYLCYYRVNTGSSQTDGLADYPDSAYLPYLELKKSFTEWGVYEEVKQSFLNCAISFMRYFYDKINKCDSFIYLHNKLRCEVFDKLEIGDMSEKCFKDKRLYMWIREIIDNSAQEILFNAVRAYSSENNTSILRFKFPFNRIERQSNIALIGAGIMGRHYYSQIMLSGYCDVVCWVEKENPFKLSYISDYSKLDKVSFDYAVIAYTQTHLIENAISYLKKLGVSDDKIILEE